MEFKEKHTTVVKALLDCNIFTKTDLAEKLGISRPTLDTRIKQHNWKKGELAIIETL